MKLTTLLLSSISVFSLSSCLEDLDLSFLNDTDTDTSTSTNTQNQVGACEAYESNIDFNFQYNEDANLTIFDASSSLHSDCNGSSSFDTYTWDFGDGTIVTSNLPITSHEYSAPSLYSVTLTASINEYDLSTTREVFVDTDIQMCDALASHASFTHFADPLGNVTFDASQSYIFEDCAYQPITAYHWDFGDGQTLTTPNNVVTHLFENLEIFPVSLTVSSDQYSYSYVDIVDFHYAQLALWDECGETAYVNQLNIENPIQLEVMFSSDQCQNLPLNYIWEMGDGTMLHGNSVSHNYEPGSLNHGHVIMDSPSIGIFHILPFEVEVPINHCYIHPISAFSTSSQDRLVNFDASLSTSPCNNAFETVQYFWDFGDGNSQNSETAFTSHEYSENGIYNVTLIVTDHYGASAFNTMAIEVYEPELVCEPIPGLDDIETHTFQYTATFDASNYFGFGCNNQYPENEYTWEFGDGTTLITTAPFISHTYKNNGTYSVSVTNSNNVVAFNNTRIEFIPVCTDVLVGSTCSEPYTLVSIQAVSTDSYIYSTNFKAKYHSYLDDDDHIYSWKSSNGQTGSGKDFVLEFDGPGVYEVMLTTQRPIGEELATVVQYEVSDEICIDPSTITETAIWTDTYTETSTSIETDIAYEMPYENLEIALPQNNIEVVPFSKSGLNAGLEMYWDTPECKTYVWNFGDGYLLESSSKKVNHEYQIEGTYDVRVWDGFNNGHFELTIDNTSTCENPPVASYTYYSVSNTAYFDASASSNCGNDIIYVWDFGFGDIIETASPYISHTFRTNSYTDAELTIKGTDSYMYQYIPINALNIDLNHSYTSDELLIHFSAIAIILNPAAIPDNAFEYEIHDAMNITPPPLDEFTYSWDLGDGTTAVGSNLSHSYQEEGRYTVILTATHLFTNETVTKQFSVSAHYDPEPLENIDDLQAEVTGNSVYITANTTTNIDPNQQNLLYLWDFGDGSSHSLYIIPFEYHTYSAPGVYTISLTVTDINSSTEVVETYTVQILE